MIYKGLMLTNAMLASESDEELFDWGLTVLADYDLQLVEFYAPDLERSRRYGRRCQEYGYTTVFHSALDQKRSGWCRLCAEGEALRKESLEFTKRSIDKAAAAGAVKAVIQSGTYPQDPSFEGVCLDALIRSLEELSDFVGQDILLSVEPCDRSIDVRQLIGPALETCSMMEKLDRPNVSLTMDTAHIALTFEDPYMAVKLCKPYSNHIHLANCYIDREHPLFGDKHPLFGAEGGSIGCKEAEALFGRIAELYEGGDLYISTEMIGREPDQRAYFTHMLDSMPWFFTRRQV